MRTAILLSCLVQQFFLQAQQGVPPIGSWRDHLPYANVIDIANSSDKIYCATPYSVFTIEKADHRIERFSKTTGLSETGVSAIAHDDENEKLVIAYNNSNIDIIYRNDIVNIPDIKRSNPAGNKAILGIYPYQGNYYLSTGLGIIVIDGDRFEIKETWLIGNTGAQVKVNALATDLDFFYAATDEGLKKAALSSPALADYNNWQLISGLSGLSAGSIRDILNTGDKMLLQKDDSLFVQSGSQWDLFYTDGWQITNTSLSGNRIHLSQRKNNGDSRIAILNNDGTVFRILSQPAFISFPRKAITVEGITWIADQEKGLTVIDAQGEFQSIIPNSPAGLATGELLVKNNTLYVAAGSVNDNFVRQHNADGFYIFTGGDWKNYNAVTVPQLDSTKDILNVAVDPVDASLWAGSFGDGLLHVLPTGSIEILKQNILGISVTDPMSYRVAGLAFDIDNNLWISNYGASQPLLVRKPDGSLQRFAPPFSLTENALAGVIIDDLNYKWIIAPKGGGLIAFDHGLSIDNSGDDRWKKFTTGSGNGNLPGSEVLSIAKDRNGFIWIGTNNGVAVMQCTQDAFTGASCDAVWPIVQEGNFAGYLFKGEEVNSIAVDGADRKWLATNKGAFLISASGEEVIYQFTEDNSPLLSNVVHRVTIDGATGEVYFATAKGICSFRSTATQGGDGNQNILVFPNPVPPGYEGTIGIRGLAGNAFVKITELDGRLVWQARALGGQAVWNGRDYKGRKISTGVYLVLVSNDERTEKKAGKIVFINK